MRAVAIFGFVLVLLGGAALAYQGVTYTTRGEIVRLGPIDTTAQAPATVAVPPVVAALAVLAGVAMVIAGRRKRKF